MKSTSRDPRSLAWPLERLADGILALARQARLPVELGASPETFRRRVDGLLDVDDATDVVQSISRAYALDADSTEILYPDLDAFLRSGGPAVILVPGEARFWLIARGASRHVTVIAPNGETKSVDAVLFKKSWYRDQTCQLETDFSELFERLSLDPSRAERARDHLLSDKLREEPIPGVWLVRLATHRPLLELTRRFGLTRDLAMFLGVYSAEYALLLISWWLLGEGALSGSFDRGWLWAWALVLLSSIPLHLLSMGAEARFSIRLGALLRDRMLNGILRLHPDETRRDGVAHHLSRVLESSALESLVLNGGSLALLGGLELVVAFVMMGLWGGGLLQMGLLLAWVGAGLGLARRYASERSRWTARRLDSSHHLIEVMLGHRTRIAQQAPSRWYRGEDAELSEYVCSSRSMDAVSSWLFAWPRGWVVVGCLPVMAGFVSGNWPLARIAVSIGLVLLAARALSRGTHGLGALVDARIAWSSIEPLMKSASRPIASGDGRWKDDRPPRASTGSRSASTVASARSGRTSQPLLDISRLSYTYPGRVEPTFRGLDATARRGEKILLEAPSGGGKSTLVSILSGTRAPRSGLVLMDGYDLGALGELGWTRRVAAAPQFNENHIITETFAFNLLMGRRWPPPRRRPAAGP